MIRSAPQRFTFVRVEKTLWAPRFGNPDEAAANDTSDPATASATQRPSEFNGKLRGTFTFPFSLALPPSVVISDHGPKEMYDIPSTFKDRAASVNYKLVAIVNRGLFTAEHTCVIRRLQRDDNKLMLWNVELGQTLSSRRI